jgi:hypothetical protein
MDAMVKAKLAQLAAMAEVTKIKAERNQHWDNELSQECSKIANLAKEIAEQAKQFK